MRIVRRPAGAKERPNSNPRGPGATMFRRLFCAGVLVGLGCTTNPVTGKKMFTLYTEAQEIELGKEAAADVAKSVGLYDAPEANAIVDRVGKKIAQHSE